MAAGAYGYLTFGGEGAAAMLGLATSHGVVMLGLASMAVAIAAKFSFGALGILGEVSVIFTRYLRNRLQRQDV